MSDSYQVTRKGLFNWELSVAENGKVFSTKRYWFKRSAEQVIKWHSAYTALIRRRR